MLFMLFLGLRVDDNVINEYYDKRVKVFMEDSVHEIHKCSSCICETKWHNQELIMTITGSKGRLLNIFIPTPKMMVTLTKINLWLETRPLKLVEQVIYSGKWILILDSDFIELPIIDTHSKGSIFLFHKQHSTSPRWYARPNETLIIEIF